MEPLAPDPEMGRLIWRCRRGMKELDLLLTGYLRDSWARATAADAALQLEGELMKHVDQQLGAVARPARVRFVSALPKTRSGKLLRRAIQAVCEGRDAGDLTTIEDPATLQQIRELIAAP